MFYNLLINLLLAHIIGDFYLQSNAICLNKIKFSCKGSGLWIHSIIIGLLSWLVVWDMQAWMLIALIFASHLLIDYLKSILQIKFNIYKINSKNKLVSGHNFRYDIVFFITDQFLHILTLVGLSYYWTESHSDWHQFKWLSDFICHHPLRFYSIVGLLLAIRPMNILILQILKAYKLNNAEETYDHGNFHSGALIGYTERTLMLIFVILSQYEAIGFLIAAKSILRFNEASSENEKSEYVLCGTFLSLLGSICLGLGVLYLSHISF